MITEKSDFKDFIDMFGLLLALSLLNMSVLFGIGWAVMYYVNNEVVPLEPFHQNDHRKCDYDFYCSGYSSI